MTKLKYEPHPVSSERKRELKSQGYRILDIAFAPPEVVAEAQAEVHAEEAPKRGRKPKADGVAEVTEE